MNFLSARNSQNSNYFKNPDQFLNISHEVLNHYSPRKKKYARGNNKPFMTKVLSKVIMQRTLLRNKFSKRTTHS